MPSAAVTSSGCFVILSPLARCIVTVSDFTDSPAAFFTTQYTCRPSIAFVIVTLYGFPVAPLLLNVVLFAFLNHHSYVTSVPFVSIAISAVVPSAAVTSSGCFVILSPLARCIVTVSDFTDSPAAFFTTQYTCRPSIAFVIVTLYGFPVAPLLLNVVLFAFLNHHSYVTSVPFVSIEISAVAPSAAVTSSGCFVISSPLARCIVTVSDFTDSPAAFFTTQYTCRPSIAFVIVTLYGFPVAPLLLNVVLFAFLNHHSYVTSVPFVSIGISAVAPSAAVTSSGCFVISSVAAANTSSSSRIFVSSSTASSIMTSSTASASTAGSSYVGSLSTNSS